MEFTADAIANLSNSEKALFTDGINFWSSKISGYRDGVSRDWNLEVDVFSTAASGGVLTLGSAGASGYDISEFVPGSELRHGVFIFSTGGQASFNIHNDAGALDADVIRHEIGHALGIGTLWEANELYNDGDDTNNFSYSLGLSTYSRTLRDGTPGQYMGPAALAAYREEFDADANYVPVELDGGDGTKNGHWNEVVDNRREENGPGFDQNPGDGLPAPIVTAGENQGESLDNELMTGVKSGSMFVSQTTIASLYDIGFEIVPEPETFALLLGCFSFLYLKLKRRSPQRRA